jgi:nickel/cobalt exporter
MPATSVPLLLVAAGSVGFLHSILPDHWVPLAVVARTQRWSLLRVARISLLASVGHVLTSIILAGIIALVGLQFRSTFESEQARIVGTILVLTGIAFLLWGILGQDHHHEDRAHELIAGSAPVTPHHDHDEQHDHSPTHSHDARTPDSATRRLAAIVVPFGAAASPDLTVLPVALAAAAISLAAVGGVLLVFSLATLVTFVVLTVTATVAGYQVKGEWLEEHGNAIAGVVLTLIGIAVFTGLV